MIPFFAQLPTASTADINTVIMGGLAILAGIALWRQAFPPRQPPLEQEVATKVTQPTDPEKQFVTVAMLDKELGERYGGLKKSIEKLSSELKAEDEKRSSRITDLHRKTNRTNTALASLIGAFNERFGSNVPVPMQEDAS